MLGNGRSSCYRGDRPLDEFAFHPASGFQLPASLLVKLRTLQLSEVRKFPAKFLKKLPHFLLHNVRPFPADSFHIPSAPAFPFNYSRLLEIPYRRSSTTTSRRPWRSVAAEGRASRVNRLFGRMDRIALWRLIISS